MTDMVSSPVLGLRRRASARGHSFRRPLDHSENQDSVAFGRSYLHRSPSKSENGKMMMMTMNRTQALLRGHRVQQSPEEEETGDLRRVWFAPTVRGKDTSKTSHQASRETSRRNVRWLQEHIAAAANANTGGMLRSNSGERIQGLRGFQPMDIYSPTSHILRRMSMERSKSLELAWS